MKNDRQSEEQYTAARVKMVQEQIEWRGIHDRTVLDAMLSVPRHLFVPIEYRNEAYEDYPIHIGFRQTISQPYIVAYMIEKLRLSPSDRVLEIGAGSGYQAAVMAQIVTEVFAVEIIPELAQTAEANCQALHYNNVHIETGNGRKGWKTHSPYHAIIVAAASEDLPKVLIDQLAPEGRMIIPIGRPGDIQNLILYEKTSSGLSRTNLLAVSFVPLVKAHPA